MRNVSRQLRKLLADRRGVSSTELGVVLALVTLGTLQAMSSLGQEVDQNLDMAQAEVIDNRPHADPFARGASGARAIGGEPSVSSGGGDGVAEPAAASDGGMPEPAAASVAPDALDWGGPGPGGGGVEPPTSTRTVGPRT